MVNREVRLLVPVVVSGNWMYPEPQYPTVTTAPVDEYLMNQSPVASWNTARSVLPSPSQSPRTGA
jgi:hypothetical protein